MPDLNLTDSYDYHLPEGLVASDPTDARSDSGLLEVHPDGRLIHRRFHELPELLESGDLLVRNVARVVPARLEGRKVGTRGRVELLVLEPVEGDWETPGPTLFYALYRASKPLRAGSAIEVGTAPEVMEVVEVPNGGRALLSTRTDRSLLAMLERCGQVPLPPYIVKRRQTLQVPVSKEVDRNRYQTVYARQPGAVAAPTAGLHFTPELFETLERRGVETVDLCLDVGVGTFRPIEVERLDLHQLHRERYHIDQTAADRINAARREGRRIVAVGTTALRSLEDQAVRGSEVRAGRFETELFIRPGVPVRWVGALVTNFHLPRSSLLTLVCAFAGYERVMAAYREAIERRYRFYSYGDAMFLRNQRC
ncbi:MAG: tRNA preQ1(34) S-adenosylmethionine ribosyltransferase-isomerase QueA [Bradymonadales bacterium]|nr:tRNA preQ1(34) S-adenosylmethionine ribosyltransferase-isomerase QueA [Bradymonadales bacterium]